MKIAHMSDLHICRENGAEEQLAFIIDLFREAQGKGADYYVLTGDLVEYSNLNELEYFLELLEAKLGITHHYLVIIPGNHDIYPVSAYRRLKSLWSFRRFPEQRQKFLEIIKDLAPRKRPMTLQPFPYFLELSSKWLFCAVDTVDYKTKGSRSCGRGKISSDLIVEILRTLERNYPERQKILLLHHYPFQHGQKKNIELDFVNLEEVQKFILRNDFKLVLCGHAHSQGGTMRSLGATTVVNSSSNPKRGNYVYTLIELTADDFKMEIFRKEFIRKVG